MDENASPNVAAAAPRTPTNSPFKTVAPDTPSNAWVDPEQSETHVTSPPQDFYQPFNAGPPVNLSAARDAALQDVSKFFVESKKAEIRREIDEAKKSTVFLWGAVPGW